MKPFDICKTLEVGQRVKHIVFKDELAEFPLTNAHVTLSISNGMIVANDRDSKQATIYFDWETKFNYTDVEKIEL